MATKAQLYSIARDLRCYLEWQRQTGTDGVVAAPDAARQEWEARQSALQQARVEQMRQALVNPETPSAQGTSAPPEQRRPEQHSPAPTQPHTTPTQTMPAPSIEAEEALGRPQLRVDGRDADKVPDEVHSSGAGALWKQLGSRSRSTFASAPPKRAPAPSGSGSQPDTSATSKPRSGAAKPEMSNLEKLEFLRNYLGACTRCPLHAGRTNIVYGQGNPEARLMFIGEAPGQHEDEQGLPFVGPSGQLLDKMIRAMKFRREDVYIANVVKCRPPGNRDPSPQEIRSCAPFITKQIAAIEPLVIVTLGRFATQTLLQSEEALGAMRGRWHEFNGVAVMPTYHPAYILRNEDMKKPLWEDLQQVMARLSRGAQPQK